MERDAVLDLATRRRIHDLVRDYPGLHIREVARQLGTSVALVEYHLPFFLDHGIFEAEQDERYLRLYLKAEGGAPSPTPKERRALGVLRSRIPLQVVLFLLDRGPAKHKDIAEALDLGKSKLSFHLRKLEAAGLVGKTDDGRFQTLRPQRVTRLLLDYKPTPDTLEEFAELWLSLYGG